MLHNNLSRECIDKSLLNSTEKIRSFLKKKTAGIYFVSLYRINMICSMTIVSIS
jgi:hypothetical protein